jgi:Ca-activated chloride channel family protein
VILAAAWQFSLLGLPARLAEPSALVFAGISVLAGLLWARMLWQRARALRKAVPERLVSRMAPKAGNGRDLWAGGTTLTGLVLLSIAAAQPQCGTHTTQAKRYGMDVVIAIDASNSMSARDVKPSRLDRAKLELSELIDRLRGDRVGIVVFAGDAFVQCPLTSDYAAAKLFLRAVNPKDLPQQGTALGPALKTAGTLFEGGDRGESGRALVVLTDGEDHEGDVEEETEKLAEKGVRVFTVGVGSRTGEPIPLVASDGSVVGYKKDRNGKTVMTRLNEEVLQAIATKGNGRYVHSAAGDLGVGEVAEELSRMNKAEYEAHLSVQYDDRFESFAWPGLVLLLVGVLFGEGRLLRRKEVA